MGCDLLDGSNRCPDAFSALLFLRRIHQRVVAVFVATNGQYFLESRKVLILCELRMWAGRQRNYATEWSELLSDTDSHCEFQDRPMKLFFSRWSRCTAVE